MGLNDATRPLRVLLVTDTDKPIGELRDTLARLHYEMLDEVATPARLPAVVEKERPDVVIIDTESPSRDTLEQLAVMHARAPRPVLMFSPDSDQQLIRAAVGAGVSAYLVEGLSAERLAPIIEVALARFSHDEALRRRLAEVENELADRKLIDRAKRLLMETRRLSEHDAYATLRRSAMDQGIKIVEAARQLLVASRNPDGEA
ncbi:ANTAR domain-containing response regulator [Burkholderia sp. 22PA0099]|uniref:ANTAR domain-containing response regulator n=1 Tax=unclassified Burkholderia TaxID=2613784 RepID=UPI0039C4A082